MKYAIKEDKSNAEYLNLEANFVFTLANAAKFGSIADAITFLLAFAKDHPTFMLPRYTIVGVKEINTPTYEEVVL